MSMIAERLTAQLLTGEPARDPAAVAERLLAIQGQDPRGARLAIRARTTGLSAADVDRALGERELLITWLNRGTLHLVRSEDYHWLQALTAPTLFNANARRLAQEGLPPAAAARGVEVIERSLAADGPLTRLQLRERLDSAGVRTEGQALVHLLMLASLRGLIVRGPMVGAHHVFVLVRDWLDPSPPIDRSAALAELARRYLIGHAPADERDLAKWVGLALRDIRAGLHAIAPLMASRPDGLLALVKSPPAAELPRAAPARRLRSPVARLALARGNPRPTQISHHEQWPLQALRARARARRRQLAYPPRRGRARAIRPPHASRHHRAGCGWRGRGSLPWRRACSMTLSACIHNFKRIAMAVHSPLDR